MANFVSTTIGYSDPLKAQSIKALEARQKDMQAQIAAAQAGGITPENTQTPIQGFGHLANQLGDSFRQGRLDSAAAAGRDELAATIAQGPKGADGNWSPEQLAVMSRRDPEFMSKLIGQQHERGNLRITEGGLDKRNTDTIGGQNARNAADITSREKVVGIEQGGLNARSTADITSREKVAAGEQGGLNFRQSQQIAATADEGNRGRAATEQLQANRFSLEAGLERVKAAINEATQRREFAFKSGLTDQVAKYDQQLATLNAELKGRESKLDRAHQDATLNTRIAADERQIQLRADLAQAEGDRQRAAAAGLQKEQLEAEEKITRIKGDLNLGLEDIKAGHARDAQTQAEAARAALPQSPAGQVGHDVNQGIITPKVGAAATEQLTAPTPAAVKALDDLKAKYIETSDAAGNIERLEGLLKAGVDRGPLEPLRTFESTSTGGALHSATGWGSDKARAERTTEYNRILNLMSTAEMSRALTGATTNFELQHFVKIYNDPKSSDKDRSDALTNLMAKVNAYKASHGEGIKSLRGDVSAIDAELGKRATRTPDTPAAAGAAPAAAAVPRPEGKDDATLRKEADAAMNDPRATPAAKAAIQQRLQAWGVK